MDFYEAPYHMQQCSNLCPVEVRKVTDACNSHKAYKLGAGICAFRVLMLLWYIIIQLNSVQLWSTDVGDHNAASASERPAAQARVRACPSVPCANMHFVCISRWGLHGCQ